MPATNGRGVTESALGGASALVCSRRPRVMDMVACGPRGLTGPGEPLARAPPAARFACQGPHWMLVRRRTSITPSLRHRPPLFLRHPDELASASSAPKLSRLSQS